jgi:hypothetical protein
MMLKKQDTNTVAEKQQQTKPSSRGNNGSIRYRRSHRAGTGTFLLLLTFTLQCPSASLARALSGDLREPLPTPCSSRTGRFTIQYPLTASMSACLYVCLSLCLSPVDAASMTQHDREELKQDDKHTAIERLTLCMCRVF